MIRGLFLGLLAACLLAAAPARAGELDASRLATEGLDTWEHRIFQGHTRYTLVNERGRRAIKAASQGAASGLWKKIAVDPEKHPLLRFSWKVETLPMGADGRKKEGDDYAARVYVVFPGFFPWQTKALCYVWAARQPVGAAFPSPYTENAWIVVLQSGPAKAGSWQRQEVDFRADFKRLFKESPPRVGAVAVMTDTDNTKSRATAYYGDITLDTGK